MVGPIDRPYLPDWSWWPWSRSAEQLAGSRMPRRLCTASIRHLQTAKHKSWTSWTVLHPGLVSSCSPLISLQPKDLEQYVTPPLTNSWPGLANSSSAVSLGASKKCQKQRRFYFVAVEKGTSKSKLFWERTAAPIPKLSSTGLCLILRRLRRPLPLFGISKTLACHHVSSGPSMKAVSNCWPRYPAIYRS